MRRFSLIFAAAAAFVLNSCTNPETEARQWDEIQTLQNAILELRSHSSDLEVALDSLRHVAAKQDTALRLLTDFTGAIVPGYRNP